VKAVNLIPDEQRRGVGGATGRSDGAAYALVGFLAGLVVLAAVYALSHQQVADRRAQAAKVTAQVAREQSRISALNAYTTFLSLSTSRVRAAEQLAAARFDWAHAIHEIGRVLPYDVAITSIDGKLGGQGGSGSSVTGSTADPVLRRVPGGGSRDARPAATDRRSDRRVAAVFRPVGGLWRPHDDREQQLGLPAGSPGLPHVQGRCDLRRAAPGRDRYRGRKRGALERSGARTRQRAGCDRQDPRRHQGD